MTLRPRGESSGWPWPAPERRRRVRRHPLPPHGQDAQDRRALLRRLRVRRDARGWRRASSARSMSTASSPTSRWTSNPCRPRLPMAVRRANRRLPAPSNRWSPMRPTSTPLPRSLVRAVARAESAIEPAAVSPKGAQGVMQLMPGTAKELGVQNAFDAAENIDAGARLLRQLLEKYDGRVAEALAAYNAGPGAVARHKGVPPYRETRGYIRKVVKDFEKAEKKAPPKPPRPGRSHDPASSNARVGLLDARAPRHARDHDLRADARHAVLALPREGRQGTGTDLPGAADLERHRQVPEEERKRSSHVLRSARSRASTCARPTRIR